MYDDPFDDLPILAEIGDALQEAVDRENRGAPERRRRRLLLRGPVLRGIPLGGLLALLVAATAAAATLLALRATVISPPADRDLPSTMRPAEGTSVVSPVTSVDPDGGAPWAVRTSRSSAGLTCGTVGQVVDGDFGLVGLDGTFRLLPEQIIDGCGKAISGQPTLIGVRTFDADEPRAARTVLYGVAGEALRRVTVTISGRSHPVEVGPRGAFVLALRGFPEDSAPRVDLRYADGSDVRREFPVPGGVAADPEGGIALRAETSGFEKVRCTSVVALRRTDRTPIGPLACTPGGEDRVLLEARRFAPGDRGSTVSDWDWKDGPARTVAWGNATGARRIVLLGAGRPRTVKASADGDFVVTLPAAVDPDGLRVRVTLGARRTRTVERRAGERVLTDEQLRRLGPPRAGR